jgi:hypothetical protein
MSAVSNSRLEEMTGSDTSVIVLRDDVNAI